MHTKMMDIHLETNVTFDAAWEPIHFYSPDAHDDSRALPFNPESNGAIDRDRIAPTTANGVMVAFVYLPYGLIALVSGMMFFLHRRRARVEREFDPRAPLRDGPAVVSGPARLVGGLIQAINPVCGAGSSQGRVRAVSSTCAPGISGTVIDPMVVRDGGGPGAGCPLDQIREMPAVIPAPAVRGQPQNIETWGPTGSIVAVFASFMTPFDPIVLPIGDVWLDPSLTLHVASGAVDSQRHVRFTTTIPSWLEIGDVLVVVP